MKVALVSNWDQTIGCGVGNFGVDWSQALQIAGHEVSRCRWNEATTDCEKVVINWDSGTMPPGELMPKGAVVFVHHIYRGQPEGLADATVLCPMRDTIPHAEYFPYPVSPYRCTVPIERGTVGVTTIRKEGLDYLTAAAARRGLRICPPDRWRSTTEEIARLSACECLAAWYTNSPGRSLALATMLAAQRPLLLSDGSQMFEYAAGSEEVYWAPYTNQEVEIIARGFDQILADGHAARIPTHLAANWSWPVAIQRLEQLW
jgi:hypothetical protein